MTFLAEKSRDGTNKTRDIAVTVLRKPVINRDNNVTDIMSVTGFSRSAQDQLWELSNE